MTTSQILTIIYGCGITVENYLTIWLCVYIIDYLCALSLWINIPMFWKSTTTSNNNKHILNQVDITENVISSLYSWHTMLSNRANTQSAYFFSIFLLLTTDNCWQQNISGSSFSLPASGMCTHGSTAWILELLVIDKTFWVLWGTNVAISHHSKW